MLPLKQVELGVEHALPSAQPEFGLAPVPMPPVPGAQVPPVPEPPRGEPPTDVPPCALPPLPRLTQTLEAQVSGTLQVPFP
jgi:hypothetical protein